MIIITVSSTNYIDNVVCTAYLFVPEKHGGNWGLRTKNVQCLKILFKYM